MTKENEIRHSLLSIFEMLEKDIELNDLRLAHNQFDLDNKQAELILYIKVHDSVNIIRTYLNKRDEKRAKTQN